MPFGPGELVLNVDGGVEEPGLIVPEFAEAIELTRPAMRTNDAYFIGTLSGQCPIQEKKRPYTYELTVLETPIRQCGAVGLF